METGGIWICVILGALIAAIVVKNIAEAKKKKANK